MSGNTKILSPVESFGAAVGSYRLRSNTNLVESFQDSDVSKYFDFSSNKAGRLKARSGMFEFKQRTGFSTMAMGKNEYEREAILVCRGTDNGKDWLSDINVGMQVSRSGHIVHAGFNRNFDQLIDPIFRFMSLNHPTMIHCIGHSLGGALANLAAESIVRHGCKAKLYTFGAPRVGTLDFATRLSLHPRLGGENIFRVYHSSDPVSMLPLFPFVHAPQPGGEYYMNKLLTINPWDHKLPAYTQSLKNVKNWDQISNPHPCLDAQIKQWVDSDLTLRYCGLNGFNLGMAMKSIQLLIKETLTEGWNGVSAIASGSATILDQLSLAVSKAGKISKPKEGMAMNILTRILKTLSWNIRPDLDCLGLSGITESRLNISINNL